MAEITLYSAQICPFAHRTRLTLIEKHIEFELIEINLLEMPDWFDQISPYRKVPVLKYGKDLVWESSVINEYLQETFPQPSLFPSQPGQRAWARFWIDFANTKFVPSFYKLLLEQEPEKQARRTDELKDHLLFMEQKGRQHPNAGTYWLNDRISLVDIAFYPFFERLCVLEYYRDFTLPTECLRLAEWWQVMAERDSVRQTLNPPELYIKAYAHYADGSAGGSTARDMRDG